MRLIPGRWSKRLPGSMVCVLLSSRWTWRSGLTVSSVTIIMSLIHGSTSGAFLTRPTTPMSFSWMNPTIYRIGPEMYSAELNKKTVMELKRLLKPHLPDLTKALQEINQALIDKRKACDAEEQPALVEYELPEALLTATRRFVRLAETWLSLNRAAEFRPALLDFYFQCNTYLRTADYFDVCYVSYFERQDKSGLKARLFCLDPAPLLKAALVRSQATIFFSATLLPIAYFQQVLTGATTAPTMTLPTPFPRENTRLLIHNRISTRYKRRQESYEAIATAIEAICSAREGNYLIFFPSYAYLQAVAELLRPRLPEEQLLIQAPG